MYILHLIRKNQKCVRIALSAFNHVVRTAIMVDFIAFLAKFYQRNALSVNAASPIINK